MKQPERRIFRSHDDVLEQLARALDITDAQFELAVRRYKSLGNWLDRPESSLAIYSPEISPQGSFLLGTVTRPVDDSDTFDLDLVCRLSASKADFSQAMLKESVGTEIISYAKAKSFSEMPEDKRRCWTLTYQDDVSFHMDILPALPDGERYQMMMMREGFRDIAGTDALSGHAIAITDDRDANYHLYSDDWPISNPFGFAEWFRGRMQVRLYEAKAMFRDQQLVTASVEDVPDYKVRTPLQQSIQLLKRHRDMMFGDDDDKPISIIISTLSAHAYQNEATISEALTTILTTMDQHILPEGAACRVPNPVNPNEDFADKWSETPRKEKLFWTWLAAARKDFGVYVQARPFNEMPDRLRKNLGEHLVEGTLAGLVGSAIAAPAIVKSAEANIDPRLADAAESIRSSDRTSKPWTTKW